MYRVDIGVGHRHMSDTGTHLLERVFVLHGSLLI